MNAGANYNGIFKQNKSNSIRNLKVTYNNCSKLLGSDVTNYLN